MEPRENHCNAAPGKDPPGAEDQTEQGEQIFPGAGLVQAQTTESPTSDDRAKAETATTNRDRADDRDFDWGWLGLIGLLGLAGLAGRTREAIATRRSRNVRN